MLCCQEKVQDPLYELRTKSARTPLDICTMFVRPEEPVRTTEKQCLTKMLIPQAQYCAALGDEELLDSVFKYSPCNKVKV